MEQELAKTAASRVNLVTTDRGKVTADLRGSGLFEVSLDRGMITQTIILDEALLADLLDDLGFFLHWLAHDERQEYRARFFRHLQARGNLGFEAVEFLFNGCAVRENLRRT